MLDAHYLEDLKQDPALLDIYKRAIKPFETATKARHLTSAVFSDADFLHVLDALSEGKVLGYKHHPHHFYKATDDRGACFFIDLLTPLWREVYFKSDRKRKNETDYGRYRRRAWSCWTVGIISDVLDLKRRDDQARDELEFAPRLHRDGHGLRDFFIAKCTEAARDSLLVETLRREVLKKIGGNPEDVQKLRKRESMESRLLLPSLPFYLAGELIFWLNAYLSGKKTEDDLANQSYFILDDALQQIREFDKSKGREADGAYHQFRERVFNEILKSRRLAIVKKLMHKNFERFRRVGVIGSDFDKEVDRASLEAVDKFNPVKTGRPFGYFQIMIEKKAYTSLRKVETRWKKILFEDAIRAVNDAEVMSLEMLPAELGDRGRNVIDKLAEPLPEEMVQHLQPLLTKNQAEVLVAKAYKEDDADLSIRLRLSKSRIRGLSAEARKKILKNHPLPALLLASLGY